MAKVKTNEEITFDIYREIYKKSKEELDFDKILDEAEVNENGRKNIHFDKCTINENTVHNIIEKHLKRFKRKSEFDKRTIRACIYLGRSPINLITENE